MVMIVIGSICTVAFIYLTLWCVVFTVMWIIDRGHQTYNNVSRTDSISVTVCILILYVGVMIQILTPLAKWFMGIPA